MQTRTLRLQSQYRLIISGCPEPPVGYAVSLINPTQETKDTQTHTRAHRHTPIKGEGLNPQLFHLEQTSQMKSFHFAFYIKH